jgi:hypothetical protein
MALSYPTLTEGAWNKVMTNKKTGIITRLKSQYKFYKTSVATGAAPPLAAVKDYSPVCFEDSSQLDVSNTTAIDVYLWPEDATDSGGSIANAVEVDS